MNSISKINSYIYNNYDNNFLDSIKDINCLQEYINCKSVKIKIEKLKNILKKNIKDKNIINNKRKY